jgi:hypothetical protein
VYGRRELKVREISSGFAITLADRQRPLVTVVQDTKYPSMWRVVEENGDLSDMVNLSRAIDAAMHRAMSILNKTPEPASTAVTG